MAADEAAPLPPAIAPAGDAAVGSPLLAGSASDLAALFARIIEAAPVGVLVVDGQGRILLANAEIELLLGHPRASLLGTPVERLAGVDPARHARWREAFFAQPDTRLMGRGRDITVTTGDGRQRRVEIALRPLRHGEASLVVATLVDVEERRRLAELTRRTGELLEQRVRERTETLEAALRTNRRLLDEVEAQRLLFDRLSREDALTGMDNRREFERRLGEEIHRAARLGLPLAMAMLDLDHFKQVNDGFGHVVGDQVLQRAAALIREHKRLDDVVARYGGEEFALLLPGTQAAGARALAERIREALAGHDWAQLHPGLSVPVTVSIGLGYWHPGITPRELLAEADRRLYAAKQAGRNRVCADDGAPAGREA